MSLVWSHIIYEFVSLDGAETYGRMQYAQISSFIPLCTLDSRSIKTLNPERLLPTPSGVLCSRCFMARVEVEVLNG